jgi:hypothetical protein
MANTGINLPLPAGRAKRLVSSAPGANETILQLQTDFESVETIHDGGGESMPNMPSSLGTRHLPCPTMV